MQLLGHDASWGYVAAVKAAGEDSMVLKSVGYLAAGVFLDESHELNILMINTLQRDLKSSNYLTVCHALTASCRLVNAETVPAVSHMVVELLKHPKELVRKKSVIALHRFHQRSPGSCADFVPRFREMLCDKDPSVMGASLCALYELSTTDPNSYKNLVPSFVSILKQVVDRRLPRTYDYHRTPAPFLQIKLLQLLGKLGANDMQTSQHMYTVLQDVLKYGDNGVKVGDAIAYECVRTITSIYPNQELLHMAAKVTARFLRNSNHNLKYAGLEALIGIVQINPNAAAAHQADVVECLEDQDETLKRKTLELLYKMTRPNNVEAIVNHMIAFLTSSSDDHIRSEIVSRVVELAERYAPSNQWFISTINQVFVLGGDLVQSSVAQNVMRLIAEGSDDEEDDEADMELRASAVDSYLDLLDEKPKLPSILLQVICWVLGEYGTVSGKLDSNGLLDTLVGIAKRQTVDETVCSYAITAMSKVCAQTSNALSTDAENFIRSMASSSSTNLQQRALELQCLLSGPRETTEYVLPFDGSCEDIEVDENLGFLEGFVQTALSRGAAPYVSLSERMAQAAANSAAAAAATGREDSGLRFEAYETPTIPTLTMDERDIVEPAVLSSSTTASSFAPTSEPSSGGGGGMMAAAAAGDAKPRLKLGTGQRKWGPSSAVSVSESGGMGADAEPFGQTAPPPAPGSVFANDSAAVQQQQQQQQQQPGTPPRPGAAPDERALTGEKARLAASLFGGGDAAPVSTSSAPRARGRGGKTRSAQRPPPPVRSAHAATAAPAAPASSAMDLLLDLDASAASGAGAPAAMPAAPVDPFAAMGGLSLDGTAPAAMPPPAQTDEQQLLSSIAQAKPSGAGGGGAPVTAKGGRSMRPTAPSGPKDPFADLLG